MSNTHKKITRRACLMYAQTGIWRFGFIKFTMGIIHLNYNLSDELERVQSSENCPGKELKEYMANERIRRIYKKQYSTQYPKSKSTIQTMIYVTLLWPPTYSVIALCCFHRNGIVSNAVNWRTGRTGEKQYHWSRILVPLVYTQ